MGRDRGFSHRREGACRAGRRGATRRPRELAGPGFAGGGIHGLGAGATVKVVGDVSKITPEQKAKLRSLGVDLDALLGEAEK